MSRIVPPDAGHDHSGVVEQVELLPCSNTNPTIGVLKNNADKGRSSPLLEEARGPSLSTSVDRNSDAASVHSMPAVLISEPTSPVSQRPSATPITDSFDSSARLQHSSPSPSSAQRQEVTVLPEQRRARHRSAVEVRTSNRLSGFFTNLMHRRDYPPNNSSRDIVHEDPPPPPPLQSNSESASRASSPLPARPVTPPPKLPAPTLQELGLSLSVLTSDLSPSHFSTPPTSGAFLSPHYLLLCHAQGLDVLPLLSPPAPQPYALVRRVSFKSVVVMEQRGVLVAIAGRRDGVRVYALEEVKKAIEWRIDVEVKRERDRLRRESVKKSVMKTMDRPDSRESADKTRKTSLSTPPPGDLDRPRANLRKASHGILPPPVPLIPRPATPRLPNKKLKTPPSHAPTAPPSGHPPPYINSLSDTLQTHNLRAQPSAISLRARAGSLSNVLAAVPSSYRNVESRIHDLDSKVDWVESSDDEAIDIVAAESSGSQALDERTSVSLSASRALSSPPVQPIIAQSPNSPRTPPGSRRRNRPSNLDLSLAQSNATVSPPEPSPAPTLLTLRQALSYSPPTLNNVDDPPDPDTPFAEGDDEDDERDGRISLAQALLESRIPDLPPLGTTRSQQPILIAASHPLPARVDEPSSPHTSEGRRSVGQGNAENSSVRRRRRWSVLMSSPSQERSSEPYPPISTTPPLTTSARDRPRFTRSHSFRSNGSQTPSIQSATDPAPTAASAALGAPSLPDTSQTSRPPSVSRSSRFIPRLISNAFNGRRSDDCAPVLTDSPIEADSTKWINPGQFSPQSPPPKLEYVKLPGTKNALTVKAVETAKKSFLAILCGDSGEKVELFAGTYRTALGLSRTFILPDSPRSLELQLQGDDLVEVFLVFSQNVFGLEPATVRVREVRIGRAERRAARRRARENRMGESSNNDADAQDEETNVNVSIGVSVTVGSNVVATGGGPNRPSTPTLVASEHPSSQSDWPQTPDVAASTSASPPEELLAVATAQMGPYTTFQQLSFAPNFPLASIADEYIIPPTYPTFLEYRAEHEPNADGTAVLSETQFSPPGLPIPTPTAPRWYYRDPKNIVHGPWKASLMQAWYKDGLLPPELPVRREEDEEYTPLKDLRLQSVDPTQPFQSPIPVLSTSLAPSAIEIEKPLLSPISLLSQPRHFGPPALFFSSRGGHSTAIVDARGRSVLKGRFMWSSDEDSKLAFAGKMGDIKRLEAFDVKDRSVLVAMRQGGLEVVDLCDALLKPADESRTLLPQFNPPSSNINRRAPFVWKIGTPIISSSTSMSALTHKAKGGLSHLTSKKPSIGSGKSPANKDFILSDADLDPQDEVLFLGRKDDEIYFCERNAGSFRILRLSPHQL